MNSFLDLVNSSIKDIANGKINSYEQVLKSFFSDNKELMEQLITSRTFKNNLSLLSKLFDFNNDGAYNMQDIEFIRNNINRIEISMKLMQAATLTIETLNEISNLKLDKDIFEELSRRLTAVVIILPLCSTADSINVFREWLNTELSTGETHKEIMILLLQNIYAIVASSKNLNNALDGLKNKVCGCFGSLFEKKKNPQLEFLSKVDELGKSLDTEYAKTEKKDVVKSEGLKINIVKEDDKELEKELKEIAIIESQLNKK